MLKKGEKDKNDKYLKNFFLPNQSWTCWNRQ